MKLSLTIALCLISVGAFAHDMDIFVRETESGLAGLVGYSKTEPVEGATVTLENAAEASIASTVTGADGRFSFAQVDAGAYRVIAETTDGHRVETTYTVAERTDPFRLISGNTEPRPAESNLPNMEGAPSGDVALNSTTLETAVRHGVAPLEERIDRLEQRTGLRDIIGGIGYVVGVVGLLTLLRRRRDS